MLKIGYFKACIHSLIKIVRSNRRIPSQEVTEEPLAFSSYLYGRLSVCLRVNQNLLQRSCSTFTEK